MKVECDSIHVLSECEIADIISYSIKLLDQIGLHVEHPKMLKRLKEFGAEVDIDARVARFPAELTTSALPRSPGKVPPLKSGKITMALSGYALNFFDDNSRQIVPATKEHLRLATIVGDAMPEINFVSCAFMPRDVPLATTDVHIAETVLTWTKKPKAITPLLHSSSVKYIFDMCEVVQGSTEAVRNNPLFFYSGGIISPLTMSFESCECIFATHELGIPVAFRTMPIVGLTVPCDIGSTLILANAEIIAGILVSQALGIKSSQTDSASNPVVVDFSSKGGTCFASPEVRMLNIALNQLRVQYGLSPFLWGSGWSDSSFPGVQAGAEKMFSMLTSAYYGFPLVSAGLLGPGGDVGSLAQILIDIEIGSYLNQYMEEFQLQPTMSQSYTLLKEACKVSAMSTEQAFVTHLAEHYRKVLWAPNVFVRNKPDLKRPQKDEAYARARKRVQKLLSEHSHMAIDASQAEAIAEIRQKADREMTE